MFRERGLGSGGRRKGKGERRWWWVGLGLKREKTDKFGGTVNSISVMLVFFYLAGKTGK